jgi:HK97 family phage portal protein
MSLITRAAAWMERPIRLIEKIATRANTWLDEPSRMALANKQASATVRKGIAERMLSASMLGSSTFGWPGSWSQDRVEQVLHYKHWLFIAVRARCQMIGGLTPNLAYVRAEDTEGNRGTIEKSLFRSQSAVRQRRYQKSLHTVKPHEEVEPVGHDHPLQKLLDHPNDWDTAGELWYELELFLCLTGNAYLWVVPNAFGQPVELMAIPSHWVWPRMSRAAPRGIAWYEIRPFVGGPMFYFPEEELIHFRCKSPVHKIDGWAATTAGAEWIDVTEAINRSRFFLMQNGCFPTGAVELAAGYEDPDDPEVDRQMAKFYGRFQGMNNFGRPIITPPGAKFTPLKISPVEMDFIQTADQCRDWVLSLYGVPKELVGIQPTGSDLSWYAPMYNFCWGAISPELRYFSQKLTHGLARRWDDELRLWWDDPTPDNPTQVNADIASDYATGSITPNEVRGIRGREPYQHGGDDPLLPTGTAPFPLNTGEDMSGYADLLLTAGQDDGLGLEDSEIPPQPGEEEPAAGAGTEQNGEQGDENSDTGEDVSTDEGLKKAGQKWISELLSEWAKEQNVKRLKRWRKWGRQKCGGEGGEPGPCSQGGADKPSDNAGSPELHQAAQKAATGWAGRLTKLPSAVAAKVKQKVQEKYTALEGRYGRKTAIAIMAAGILGAATPVPGSSLIAAAPIMGVAELYLRFAAKPTEKPKPMAAGIPTNGKNGWHNRLKDEFFSDCDRDDEGHCLPGSGGSGNGTATATKPKPAKTSSRVAEQKPSAKAERAKKAHKMVDKSIQRYAEERNEPRMAKALGGVSLPDGEPIDIAIRKGSKVVHGIELKTMVDNSNGKITMDKYAQVRKIVWEQESGAAFHTIVSDDTDVYGTCDSEGKCDESKRKYYYRRGVAGSARIGSLHPVKNEAELNRLMKLPEDKLPPAAQRSDGKLRVGKWEPFVDDSGKGFRNSETGEEARPKK